MDAYKFYSLDEPFIDLEVETSHPFLHNNSFDQIYSEWAPYIFGDGEERYYVDTVYNIEVEDCHTYFVGKDGVLVSESTIQGNYE